ETCEAEPTSIRHMNPADRSGIPLDPRPHTERFEGTARAVGNRRRALVEARLLAVVERSPFEQRDTQIEVRKRQRERRSDEPAAADDDVEDRFLEWRAHRD